VLLVAAFRDTDLHAPAVAPLRDLVHEVTRRAGRSEIALDRGQDAGFVDALLDAEPNRLDAGFRAELLTLTGGHALFTVELVEDLRARGVLRRDPDGRWVAPAEIEWGDLPARVEGVIAGRLGRIPEELRRALEVGSVEGQTFTAEVLARVLALDAERVVTLLEQGGVRGQRLLVPEPVRTAGDRRLSPFRFRHILFQRHLYRSLGEAERGYLHEAVAEAIEALLGGRASARAVALARHFEVARRPARAADYRRLAGQDALRFGDHAMAVAHFEAGLTALREVDDAAVRDRLELAIQLALGVAQFAAEGYASAPARAAYTRARELCDLVDDGEARTHTLLMLASVHGLHGAPAKGVELAAEARASAAARGDRLGVALAAWRAGIFELFLGHIGAARRHLDELLEFYDPRAHAELWAVVGQDPRVTALTWGAVACGIVGDSKRAAGMFDDAVAWARRVDHPLSLAFTLGIRAEFSWCWHVEPDPAAPGNVAPEVQASRAAWAAECRRVAERAGLALPILLADHTIGLLAVQRGEVEAGIAAADAAEAAMRARGLTTGLTPVLAELAGLCVAAGRVEEAEKVLSRSAEYASASDERVAEPELLRLRGEVARSRGAPVADVEATFRRAIDLGKAMGAGRWVRRAEASLQRLAAG
jgi:tetratricopeptide (TPR) repeat protein